MEQNNDHHGQLWYERMQQLDSERQKQKQMNQRIQSYKQQGLFWHDPAQDYPNTIFPIKDLKDRLKELESMNHNMNVFDDKFKSQLKSFYSQGFRRTGRTHIIARILIETAIETGQKIYMHDHDSVFDYTQRNRWYILKNIESTCQWFRDNGCKILLDVDRNKNWFTAKLVQDEHSNICSYRMYEKLRIKEYIPEEPIEEKKLNRRLMLIAQ